MISLTAYKIVHVLAIVLTLMALGALALHAMNGGDAKNNRHRKLVAISHGVGLVLLIVTGFGMLSRLGVDHGAPWPLWVWLKIALWIFAGALIALVKRLPRLAVVFWFLLPLLAALGAWVALYKPGL